MASQTMIVVCNEKTEYQCQSGLGFRYLAFDSIGDHSSGIGYGTYQSRLQSTIGQILSRKIGTFYQTFLKENASSEIQSAMPKWIVLGLFSIDLFEVIPLEVSDFGLIKSNLRQFICKPIKWGRRIIRCLLSGGIKSVARYISNYS